MQGVSRTRPAALVFLLSLALIVIARFPAGTWTIDDAGITHSYAASIAAGYGSTAYQGGMPTEGFSNPLTLLLSVLLIWLGLFHPLVSHLVVEVLAFAAACALVCVWLERLGVRSRHAFGAGVLFAVIQLLTPACLVWYTSGLENVQLTLAMVVLLVRLESWRSAGLEPWLDGPLIVLISLIRPEAALYPAGVLLAYAAVMVANRPPRIGVVRAGLLTTVVAAALGLLLLAGRYVHFGALLPNTYHAKATGVFYKVVETDYWNNFMGYVLGDLLSYQNSGLLLGFGLLLARRQTLAMLGVLGLYVASLGLPIMAGADWMGEHRFGTATLTAGHLMFVLGLATACDRWLQRRPARAPAKALAAAAIVAVLLAWAFATGPVRYLEFIRGPHATFENVADTGGFVRLQLQRRLGLHNPIVLQPDSGASHYLRGEQSIDSLRLTDFHMARISRSRTEVLQYVFAERTPDLIDEHHRVPRPQAFWESYFSVLETENPAARAGGEIIPYLVRRDAVETAAPEPGAELLSRTRDLEVWLSGRTVEVAAPRAIVRIELLLRTPRELSAERLREQAPIGVCLLEECQQLTPFLFHPLQPEPVRPLAGRFYRHGFLVRAPDETGRYPLHFMTEGELSAGRGPYEILVTKNLEESSLVGALRSGQGDFLERTRRLAQLREQSRPRMRPAELEATLVKFRRASRDRNWSAVGFFDAAVRDFHADLLPEAVPTLTALERGYAREAAMRLTETVSERAAGAAEEKALEAARLAFGLRRLGFHWLEESSELSETLETLERWLEGADSLKRSYLLALSIAALRPQDVENQKLLLELRRLGLERYRGRRQFAPLLHEP